jgi:hypothetical protein
LLKIVNFRRSVGDKLTPKVNRVLTPEAVKVNLYPAVSFHDLFYI